MVGDQQWVAGRYIFGIDFFGKSVATGCVTIPAFCQPVSILALDTTPWATLVEGILWAKFRQLVFELSDFCVWVYRTYTLGWVFWVITPPGASSQIELKFIKSNFYT